MKKGVLFLFSFLAPSWALVCEKQEDCSVLENAKCINAECLKPCSWDSNDCPEPHLCFSDIGLCAPPCLSLGSCRPFETEEIPHLFCVNFQCRNTRIIECDQNQDCLPFEQLCQDGHCSPCNSTESCGLNYCCQPDGRCTESNNSKCKVDSFCYKNEECSSSLCLNGACVSACSDSEDCESVSELSPCCSAENNSCQKKQGDGCGLKAYCQNDSNCSSDLVCGESICRKKDWDICG